jgi:putative transposase
MFDSLLLLVALVRSAIGDRAEVAVQNLVLRQQLAVLTRPTRKQPRLRCCDKVFWVLVRRLWRHWAQHLVLVQPATVIHWHRQV